MGMVNVVIVGALYFYVRQRTAQVKQPVAA
jgi:hypothetical protein